MPKFNSISNGAPCVRMLKRFPVHAPLNWHLDERGSLIELFRGSWENDHEGPVRQAYISTTRSGVVKGWHLHMKQTDRFVCLRGTVMVAMCDLMNPEQVVRTVVLSADRGISICTVPPRFAHGWKSIGEEEAWILNLCSHEYDGTDEWRRPPHSGPSDKISFNWNKEVDG